MGRICPSESCLAGGGGVDESAFEENSLQLEYLYCKLSLNFFVFLSAFSKLRNATISFIVSVRPSVCATAHLSVCAN